MRMVTEREAVLRERLAANRAIEHVFANLRDMQCSHVEFLNYRAFADDHYPLPKVTRPRVVRDPHGMNVDWRVRDGVIVPRVRAEWGQRLVEKITAERVAVWADLLANPTEEVEEDA